jgi:DNA-binding MarR family transcriptional regulator
LKLSNIYKFKYNVPIMKMNFADNSYCRLLTLLLQAKHNLMRITEEHGLKPMQAHLLSYLSADEPASMRQLSGALMCDASNITGIVDRLETQGLITRTEDPADRRVKMIALTAAGAERRDALITELSESLQSRIATSLSPAEQKQFYALIDKIQA